MLLFYMQRKICAQDGNQDNDCILSDSSAKHSFRLNFLFNLSFIVDYYYEMAVKF